MRNWWMYWCVCRAAVEVEVTAGSADPALLAVTEC